jgi:hypothetical protein
MDFALYWLHMVDIILTRLNYVTLVMFLRYFDHSNLLPCVGMVSFTKIHMETGKFPHGFCIILVSKLFLDCNTIHATKFLYLQVYCKIFLVVNSPQHWLIVTLIGAVQLVRQ